MVCATQLTVVFGWTILGISLKLTIVTLSYCGVLHQLPRRRINGGPSRAESERWLIHFLTVSWILMIFGTIPQPRRTEPFRTIRSRTVLRRVLTRLVTRGSICRGGTRGGEFS